MSAASSQSSACLHVPPPPLPHASTGSSSPDRGRAPAKWSVSEVDARVSASQGCRSQGRRAKGSLATNGAFRARERRERRHLAVEIPVDFRNGALRRLDGGGEPLEIQRPT